MVSRYDLKDKFIRNMLKMGISLQTSKMVYKAYRLELNKAYQKGYAQGKSNGYRSKAE